MIDDAILSFYVYSAHGKVNEEGTGGYTQAWSNGVRQLRYVMKHFLATKKLKSKMAANIAKMADQC